MNKKFSRLLASIKLIIDSKPRKITGDRVNCFCCYLDGDDKEIKELLKKYSSKFPDKEDNTGGFVFLINEAKKLFADETLYMYYCMKKTRWVLARKQMVEVEIDLSNLI